MTRDPRPKTPGERITDEEKPQEERRKIADPDDRVDKKIKDRIVKARNRIDEAEEEFFVNQLGQTNPQTLNSVQEKKDYEIAKQHYTDRWGVLIRQYIRSVIPLLTSDEIPRSEQYWANEPVYSVEVPPPDESDYSWSRFILDDNQTKTARRMGLPPSFEPPEPKLVEIVGLQEVMNTQRISLTWHIDPTPDKLPPEKDDRYVELDRPLPKEAYENAVQLTDDFLDQAGIGLGVKEAEPDDGFLDL
jgi:hypothetical protein